MATSDQLLVSHPPASNLITVFYFLYFSCCCLVGSVKIPEGGDWTRV